MTLRKKSIITIIVVALFFNGCFSVSPARSCSINRAFEYCVSIDKDRSIDDCDKLRCWYKWVALHYNLSHRTLQLYAKERIFSLALKCRAEEINDCDM